MLCACHLSAGKAETGRFRGFLMRNLLQYKMGAGEIALTLRVLAVCAGNLSSGPSTYIRWLKHPLEPSSGFCRHLYICAHTNTRTHIHTNKNKSLKQKPRWMALQEFQGYPLVSTHASTRVHTHTRVYTMHIERVELQPQTQKEPASSSLPPACPR